MFTIFLTWCLTIFLNSASAQFDPTQHANWNLLDNDNCGAPQTSRIIGGYKTNKDEFPWMVHLDYTGSALCRTLLCGGSILNKKTILTTAHCVNYLKDRGCKLSHIVIGDWRIDTMADDISGDPMQTISPESMLHHSGYSINDLKHDIALIKLEKEMQYNSGAKPICMVKGSLMQNSFLGNDTIAIGWGAMTEANTVFSHYLLRVTLPVVDFGTCQNNFNNTDSATQMCVGGQDGKDTCAGDSGGPLMLLASENGPPRYYIVGIGSMGPPLCGNLNKPSVFTRVTAYTEWILDNLKEGTKNFTVVQV